MNTAAIVLTGLVAVAHLYFLVIESFLWTTPFGRRTMGTTKEVAELSYPLAKNQGLYNGFLSAGLVWGLLIAGPERLHVLTFFLTCVVIAGIVGAITANLKILFVQALPGALALGAVWLAR